MRAVVASLFAFSLVLAVPATAAQATAAPCQKGSGPKLRGADFTNGRQLPDNLRCADLTGAKLDEVDFTQKDLTGAILRNASMKEADFTQAYLEYADLRGADLTSADLGQLRAKQADLRGAIMIDVEGAQAEFPHADLSKAIMTRANLGQVTLTNAKLVGADLNEATLGQVKGRTADFTGAKLKEAKFGQGGLQHAIFKNADLTEAEFTQAELQGADFTGAVIEGASFIQADDVNLNGARGGANDVPEGTPQEPFTGDTGSGDDPTTPPTSRNMPPRILGMSPALLIILAGALGLSLTLIVWGLSHQRTRRSDTNFALARRVAEEDVTRLGEEIDTLDFDMKVNAVSGPSQDWRAALDAYEAAKQALYLARTPEELHAAAAAVHHGRLALQRVRSVLPR
ncbi:pentapeptide repeat-containing protein [Herbidospora mongoliensis]|uniref:pentapeptide repeat-containing protein n=1 Tax=Herbidospora mongoliensis TaxID=688067 RepID=UPI000836C613|nr:pentapeptide repeat-containing protein [Herbidospora mongoliensis]